MGKAVQAIGQADPSKVKDVVKNAAQDPGKAADVLQTVDASKAVDVAKDVSGKVPQVVTVSTADGGGGVAQEETTMSTTTVHAVAATKEDQTAKIQGAAKGSNIAGLFSNKNIGDVIKGATPEKVVQVVQNADPEQIAEDVAKDAQKFGEAAQDATPKEVAQAVGGSSDPSSVVDKTKDAVSISGAKEIVGTIGETDVNQLAGAVKGASPGQVADSLKDDKVKNAADIVKSKSAAQIGEAISGAKHEDLTEAIKHPSMTVLDKAAAAIAATEPRKDGTFLAPSQPTAQGDSSLPVLVVLGVLATTVICGYMVFRHLTKPRPVGMPMLNGDSNGDTHMHWMGSDARDVITTRTGTSAGFTRF